MKITLIYCRRLLAAVLLALLVALAQTGTSWSQPPPKPLAPNPLAPTLRPAVPLGMTRGTSLDLTLTGTNLQEPTALWTSFPCKATIPTEMNNGKDPAKLLVRLQVPADAPVGFHTLRLATTKGISNFRIFCIDDLPQVLRAANNRARASAQELTPPCVVVGKIDAEVSDWYKIKVAAGQRLSFEVLGRRLGSTVDPRLTIYDAKTGKELPDGYSDDAPGLQTDPRLTHVFKEAGEVLVEVRDTSWRGGEDFHYRLRIGDFPCCTTPLPMAIKRGSKATVSFAGPSGELAAPVSVQAPTDPAVHSIPVAPRGANGLHGWPVILAVTDLDEFMETEPNNEPAKANRVSVPCGVTGRLQDKGDIDHFVFAAKKGQHLVVGAQTLDLGSPSDVVLTLRDAKGSQLAVSNPSAPVASLDYTLQADGDLILAVEHLHYWGGPAETYHLRIRPYEPGFDLTVGLDRFNIAQEGQLTLPVQATRRDYAGPIELSVTGNPSLKGQVVIPMGQALGTLTITAAPTAPLGPTVFLVQGKATIAGKAVTEYANLRPVISQNLANLPVPPPWLDHTFGLTITDKPPFTLAAKLDAPMTAPGKPLGLTITATRTAGFTGEIPLTVAGLPPNTGLILPMTGKVIQSIPAKQNELKAQVNPAANAPVGTFTIVLTAKAKHNNREYVVTTTVPLTLKK
jgi:hypothetical protein